MVYKSSLRQGGSGGTGNFDNINVGDGTKPALLKITPQQSNTTFLNSQSSTDAWRIKQSGGFLYVAGYSADLLTAYSLANPSNPLQVGQVTVNNSGSGRGGSLDAAGNYVYFSDVGTGLLSIFDISAHTNPVLVGTAGSGGESTVINGNYLYTGNPGSLVVTNVTNRAAPSIIHTIGVGADALTMQGNYLYAVSSDNNKISVYDITTPSNPTFVTNYSITFNSSDSAFAASSPSALAFGNDSTDIAVYSISGSTLTFASTIPAASDDIQNVEFSGNNLLIADYNNNLIRVYSLTDPANPILLVNIPSTQASDANVTGNYLYSTSEVSSLLQTNNFVLSTQTTPDFEIYDTNGNLVDWADPDGSFHFAQGAAEITAAGDVTAVSFTGDGSGLTNVHGAPGGTTGQIQWNNAGILAGADLITDGSADIGASSGLWQIMADGTILTGFGNFIVNPDGTISVADGQMTVDNGGNITLNSSGMYGVQSINSTGGQNWQINIDGSASFADENLQIDSAGNVYLYGALFDGSVSSGSPGYIFTSTGTNTLWVDPSTLLTNYWTLSGTQLSNNSGQTVGIGNSNPIYALDIFDAYSTGFDIGSSFSGLWSISNTGAISFDGSGITSNGSGVLTAISFVGQYQNANDSAYINPDGSAAFASNNIVFTNAGNATAVAFITSGGASSQFVKGDGTLDSNTYASLPVAISDLGDGSSNISQWNNDAGYLIPTGTVAYVGDNVSEFFNDVGYLFFNGGILYYPDASTYLADSSYNVYAYGYYGATNDSRSPLAINEGLGNWNVYAYNLYDSTNSQGTTDQILSFDGTGTQWVDASSLLTGFVPYSGATSNVDLGANSIYLQSDSISIGDTTGVDAWINYDGSFSLSGGNFNGDNAGNLATDGTFSASSGNFTVDTSGNTKIAGGTGLGVTLEVNGTIDADYYHAVSYGIVIDNNGNFTGNTISTGNYIDFTQITTPGNPSSGVDRLYFKSDDNLYALTSAGVEYQVNGGGGGGSAVGPADAIQTSDGSGGFQGTGNATVDSGGNFVGAKYQLTSGAYFEDFGSFTILVIGDLIGGGAFWQIDGSGSAGFAGNVTAAAFVTSGGSSSDVVLGDGTLGAYSSPSSGSSGDIQVSNGSGGFNGYSTASLNSSGQITLTGLPGSLIGQLNINANGVTGSLKGQSSINFENLNTTKGYFIGHDLAGSGAHNFFWYDRTLNQSPILWDGDTGGTNTVYIGSAPLSLGLATPGNVIVGGATDNGLAKFQITGASTFYANVATDIVQIIRGQSAQSGDLSEWINSSSTVVAKVDPSGNNTSASYTGNNLTASKPVFTDGSKKLVSTGTVPVANGGTGQTTPVVVAASFSGTGTATTVFTVTIGTTQANNTYKVAIEPTNLLSAAVQYVTNKTTATFDVTYLAGLTGGVAFDWALFT